MVNAQEDLTPFYTKQLAKLKLKLYASLIITIFLVDSDIKKKLSSSRGVLFRSVVAPAFWLISWCFEFSLYVVCSLTWNRHGFVSFLCVFN